MALNNVDKVRENKLRRWAERRGYLLVKSHNRAVGSLTYGRYVLVPSTWSSPASSRGGRAAQLALEHGYGLDVDAMENALQLPLGEMEQLAVVVSS